MSAPDSPGADTVREHWKAALAISPECIPIERLAEPELSASDLAHVDKCVRCQTERALAMELESAEPMPDEGAAVQWIAHETRRRVFPGNIEPRPIRAGWFRLPVWATSMAAAVAVTLGVVLVLRTPPTVPSDVQPGTTYRAIGVELTSPMGDVSVLPTELRWQAVSGATHYEVKVLEVDGAEIWRATTDTTTIAVPEQVRAEAKPARTLMWSVRALDGSGNNVGQPGTATFRIVP